MNRNWRRQARKAREAIDHALGTGHASIEEDGEIFDQIAVAIFTLKKTSPAFYDETNPELVFRVAKVAR